MTTPDRLAPQPEGVAKTLSTLRGIHHSIVVFSAALLALVASYKTAQSYTSALYELRILSSISLKDFDASLPDRIRRDNSAQQSIDALDKLVSAHGAELNRDASGT